MKRTDKFLIGIVVGVVLLIVVALIFVMQPSSYLAEDTPEGVVHNYLLALQEGDYARAHGYLYSRLPGYPSPKKFESDVRDSYYFRYISSETFSVDSSNIKGIRATVTVQRTRFYEGSILDSGQSTYTFKVYLIKVGEAWRIDDADRYFGYCWDRGCL